MSAWPGESIVLDSAYDVGADDWGLWNDISYRARSRSLSAGDQWAMFVDTYFHTPGATYMGPGDTGVVSWVVEVPSGSGTVTAADGVDPGFGDPGYPSTPLGSFALTPGTNIIPSSLTVADVYALTQTTDGVPALTLTGTAGSVEVQQVKLRAWPSSAPAGSWVEHPGFDTDPTTPTLFAGTPDPYTQISGGAPGRPDWQTAWDDAAAAFVSDAHTVTDPTGLSTRNPDTTGVTLSIDAGEAADSIIPTYGAYIDCNIEVNVLAGVDWRTAYPIAPGLVEGVDWWRDPNEVYGDTANYAQRLADGSTQWSGDRLTVGITGDALVDDFAVHVDLADGDAVTVAGGVASGVTWTPYGATVTDGQVVELAADGHRWVVVSFGHAAASEAIPYPGSPVPAGTQATLQGDYIGIRSWAAMPPYRVWVADASEPAPMRLMQRGDGLGMGSGRVYGLGTRQSSGRVFGPY